MGVVSRVAWLGCVLLFTACRTESGSGTPSGLGTAGAGGNGTIMGSGAGDFVTDNGSHYRSKAECLADTDGYFLPLDRDGDGRSAWWQNYCNDYTQLMMAGAYGEDCDDTDPSVSQYSWRDADGDGATVGDSQCGVDVPDGYRAYPSRTPDCDDTDPAVSQAVYTDADGDGYGSPDAPTCLAPVVDGAPAPSGFSSNQADCDDSTADIHPEAFEAWGDGVDSDCDGHDDPPLRCGNAGASCGCELLATNTVPIISACDGSDLFVAAQQVCTACYGRTLIIIGNRGTKAASSISFSVDGRAFGSLGALAPGSVTSPIVLPPGAMQLQLEPLANECKPADDQQALESSAGICDP